MSWKKGIAAAFMVFCMALGVSGDGNGRQTQQMVLGRPDLVVENVRISPSRVNNMTDATLTFTVRNKGAAAAAKSYAGYYLSRDYHLSDDDRWMGQFATREIGRGASDTISVSLKFPMTIDPGPYYIIVKADDTNLVIETDKANNISSAALTVIPHVLPDLRVEILSVDPSRQSGGGRVNIRFRAINDGAGLAPAFRIRFYFSEDRIITSDDRAAGEFQYPGSFGPRVTGTELSRSITIPASATPGDRYVGAIVDPDNAIPETNERNNSSSHPIYVMSESLPDLTIATLQVSAVRLIVGNEIPIFCRVRNGGTAVASQAAVSYFLSDSRNFDPKTARYLGGNSLPAGSSLAAGRWHEYTFKGRLPADIGPGEKYLIAVADARGEVTELNENNNQAFVAVKIMARK